MSDFNAPRLYSTTLGYYSHSEGARYISPIATGFQFPDLVELHESRHEHLALGNATDELAQFFVKVIEWGAEELHRDHEASIRSLFGVIHEHTMYVHEVIATWASFCIFAKKHPEDLKPARKALPPFYEGVLRDGEAAFGSVTDPRIDSTDALLAFSCAHAAMNLLYPV